MNTIKIFLNKLADSKKIYSEISEKLGADCVTDKDSLSGFLMSVTVPMNLMLYISDENIINATVSEAVDCFTICAEKNKNLKAELIEDEFLNLIDEKSRMTGASKPRTLIHRDGDLHPTVHIWLIKRRDMGVFVLMQKRAHEKAINPDCYDVSAAGHVSQGDEFRNAAVRELQEELGLTITGDKLELIGMRNHSFAAENISDNELCAVYLCRKDVDIDKLQLRSSEVSKVLWAEIDEIISVMKNSDFPNCISIDELNMIKKSVF